MAHQEAAMVLEAASVVAHHLLDGTEGDVVVMVQVGLDLEERHLLGMVQTLTTVLKVVWLLSSDSVRKTSSSEEAHHPAVARLSAGLSRWMSVLAVHLARCPIKSRLTV